MEELKEALKEGLRIVVLSIIPIAIDGLSKGELDYNLIFVSATVAGLRFIDAWLHETGTAKRGLTRF